MASIAVLDEKDADFILYINFQGKYWFASIHPKFFFHLVTIFTLERRAKLPLPLQRCLLGFRQGSELFQFCMSQMTNVIRQKAYLYSLNGNSTGTSLEVNICESWFTHVHINY